MGNKYTADFETTTDVNDCRVWAYGICEIGKPEKFYCGTNLDEFMNLCSSVNGSTFYFHNLKFDGEFIISWLFRKGFKWVENKKLLTEKTFCTLISDSGLFYSMEVCFSDSPKIVIKFLDSLKVLPFTVDKIAKDFNLPIRKLEIDYKEKREKDHVLTEQEIDYVRNDVEIMARAMQIMLDMGQIKMTTGSNALAEYKKLVGRSKFECFFLCLNTTLMLESAIKVGLLSCNQVRQIG